MRTPRTKVFFVNPPNTNDIALTGLPSNTVSRGVQHTDWANFPHLGILSLASYIDSVPELDGYYLDGVVHSLDAIVAVIDSHASTTLAVCLSAITANYGAALVIAERVRRLDPEIKIVLGNDHFSAMGHKIMALHHGLVDCGFVGNEVYEGLREYLKDVQRGEGSGGYPGSVRWSSGQVLKAPQIKEAVNRVIDYRLLDRALPHTVSYAENFTRRLGDRIHQLTGRRVRRGVPVEIGRGCIKFSGDDACSFCSIQYGGMWKNELPASEAWQAIHKAWSAGYDYLYVTADELPLTFARLLLDMAESPPEWWRELSPDERPLLVGYARADGMEKPNVLQAMRHVGFRILFVGVDAGTSISLRALNKPLRNKDSRQAAERMFVSSQKALENARLHGVLIKAGFVLGHIGMNERLLEANIRTYIDFLRSGRDVIVSADIELLSPEPGSKDFNYLTNPDLSQQLSREMDLPIVSTEELWTIASKYRDLDIFDREEAINDYIKAFMPTLSKELLASARDRVRAECGKLGIVIGDEI